MTEKKDVRSLHAPTWKPSLGFPVPERPSLRPHFCCTVLGCPLCIQGRCVDDIDGEDAAGGGDERDFT